MAASRMERGDQEKGKKKDKRQATMEETVERWNWEEAKKKQDAFIDALSNHRV